MATKTRILAQLGLSYSALSAAATLAVVSIITKNVGYGVGAGCFLILHYTHAAVAIYAIWRLGEAYERANDAHDYKNTS